MKQFLFKIVLFLGIMIALDLTTGMVMDHINANTVKGDYGRNNYIATGTCADFLIFGSSRAIHHYDPEKITDAINLTCYNCGEDGMGIVTMFGRYQMIRQRHIPKLVIYDAVAGFDLGIDDMSKYIGWLRFYAEGNDSIAKLVENIDSTEKYKMWAKTYKYNSCFIDIVGQYTSKDPSTARDYKYAPLYGCITYKVDKPVKSKQFEVSAIKLSLFEKMICQCKHDNTIFVVTISPWYQATNDSEYKSLISLCKRHGITVLNHFKDKCFRNNPTLFKDASHLNIDGVKQYNRMIIEELREILNK